MALEAGTRLGHYEVLSSLGAGGMGEVYRAKDTKLQREVALKVLPEIVASDPERLARFRREAQALAALNHPNIVTIHSVEEVQGVYFLTMEVVDGQSLGQLIPKDGLPVERLLDIALALADAVSAAHDQGIIHRDLKPANVMLTQRDQVKVLDFGLAKFTEESRPALVDSNEPTLLATAEGVVMGTVPYMSPEQLQNEAVDRRTDVFSLGCVFYEMASGQPPFHGPSSAELVSSILRDSPPALSTRRQALPNRLSRIIERCLQKEKQDRFSSAGDVHYELRALQRELTRMAPSGSAGVPDSPRPGASRKSLSLTWAAISAVAIAVLAWGAWVFLGPSPAAEGPANLTIAPLTNAEGLSLSGSWSPDASQIAYDYTSNGTMDVAVMSLGGGEPRVVAGGPNDEMMPRWSPDGSKISFLSDDGTGMKVYWAPPTGGPRRTLAQTHFQYLDRFTAIGAIGSQPWSPSGDRLVFSRLEPSGVVALWQVNVESGEESRLTDPPDGAGDYQAAWSHDGEWIAFHRSPSGTPSSLYRVPASGGEPRPVLADQHLNRSVAWTPDNRSLLFISMRTGSGDIWAVDIETAAVRQLTVGSGASTPVVSSTGRIAYSQWTHETFFYQLELGSSDEHEQISLSKGNNFGQRFSPDGKQIVFQSGRSGRSEIWLHDLETGTERQLTTPPDGKEDRTPDWSPDGLQVVFLSNRDGPFQLWKTDVDGGAPRKLLEQAIPMDGDWWVNARVAPRWSTGGNTIAYLAPGDHGSTLWVVDPDGNNALQTSLSGVLRFDWYLDGTRVIYTRNTSDGSGKIEMVAVHLETGEEQLLLAANATELSVAPDGESVAYNSADGHFSMNRYLLRLALPATHEGLPRAVGSPDQLTFGGGIWHVHGGAWTPDSSRIVYTRDFDRGDLHVIDNYL